MENEIIKNLLDALNVSPSNVPLRMQVASMMMQEKMYSEAAEQYNEVLRQSYGNTKAQLGLAECYFQLGKYSAAIIVYEQLQDQLGVNDRASTTELNAYYGETRGGWLNQNEGYGPLQAREMQFDDLFFESLAIIDAGMYVEKVRRNGIVVRVFDHDNFARAKLRCEIRRWVADRLSPKNPTIH